MRFLGCVRRGTFRSKTSVSDSPWSLSLSCCGDGGWIVSRYQRRGLAAVTMIRTNDVAAAFDEVAPSYDLLVALNPGYHAPLRSAADALLEWLPRSKPAGSQPLVHLLDLGCGSGASTRAVQQAAQAVDLRSVIVGIDASTGMLEQARAKHWPAGVRFEVGQAEEIT